MQDKLHFKISAALKDIIGRDLITDDFVAIFELVKNSYDAYASRVDIYFENLNTVSSKIIIKDNGKGMDHDDLINKWLFVAYSAKREGTEDNTFDYRDKINLKRTFAGAKGIGRFSCDRLGRLLYLETTKQEENPKTEVLITEWEKFESDLKDDFIDINVLHETKLKSDYDLMHGTVLEVQELRSDWDREKLLKLKESLSKLINPNNQKEKEFSIHFHVPDLIDSDKSYSESYKKVNGEIENFIFDTLDLRTTKITSNISSDGMYIETELMDGGTLIYRIKEKNKFPLLFNINYSLYYLNRSAKTIFSRRMGLAVVNYGNVFLYKNGFRIYPFGESGEDTLSIDKRKGQGYNRYLGTRDLIGRIEIFGDNNDLRETSSRGHGLIKTKTYDQLLICFIEKVLKRLEKYVIEVQQWGLSIEGELDTNDSIMLNNNIIDLIKKITDSKDIVDVAYDLKIIDKLNVANNEGAENAIKNLKRIAGESGNEELLFEAKKAEQKLKELKSAFITVENDSKNAIEKANKNVEQLEQIKKENELLKQATNEDTVELMSIEHHINQSTTRVSKHIKKLIESIIKNFSKEIQLEYITKISLENQKISSLVKFVRKANFDSISASIIEDLSKYIYQYIENIYKDDPIKIINQELLDVKVNYLSSTKFITEFVPLEINIILDNLLDNSFKAKATEVEITIRNAKDSYLEIDFFDNGIGISEAAKTKVFNFGYTTTSGSGIGLYHVKKILNENYNGDISIVNSSENNGIQLLITFKK
ncbi:MAG TPA: ATP-binding protein [Prolixibacteraceae bacterium]